MSQWEVSSFLSCWTIKESRGLVSESRGLLSENRGLPIDHRLPTTMMMLDGDTNCIFR